MTQVCHLYSLSICSPVDTALITAQLTFTQGLMSAISAGMLIYAATVEMLAGDFVMDPLLWKKPMWMQLLALGSLAMGAMAMTFIG